jgi:hypothetical protein
MHRLCVQAKTQGIARRSSSVRSPRRREGREHPDGLGALVVGARALTFPDKKNAPWEADPRPFVAEKVEEANGALRRVLGW